jgi:NADH dehydrogenase
VALVERGAVVTVPTRYRERAKRDLILLPTVDVVEADVHDVAALTALARGQDAVVNLVGVLHGGNGRQSFDAAHARLGSAVVDACRQAGVRRLLHMSALNADPGGPSEYQRSKGRAEAAVKASGLDWTIFRPSVIFGRNDAFLNMFAKLVRVLPVVALASPNARFQPVWVGDVVDVMARSLDDPATIGRSYDLCGPKVYTLRELVAYVGRLTGRPRPIIGLNDTLSYLQAWTMEWLPVKLMTRDNYYSMKQDSVCGCPFPFGLTPHSIEAIVPEYLGGATPRRRYDRYRGRAHR